MNKIKENERIVIKKGMDSDSFFSCQLIGKIPLNLTFIVCIKTVRIMSDGGGGLTLSFYIAKLYIF